jgi:very-short-patch-repair endonuclease
MSEEYRCLHNDDCKNLATCDEIDGRNTSCDSHKLDENTYNKTIDFINKAKEKHGDKYGYWRVKYIRAIYKVNIYCKSCEKYIEQLPNNHIKGHGCKYCATELVKITKHNKLTYQRSFASHPKAIYWSNKNIDNNGKTIYPIDVYKSARNKYWFNCDKCTHDFQVSLDLANRQNCWCPYCRSGDLCDNDNCKFCFDNSFASNPKAIYWSNKNDIKPRNISKSNNKECWFDCDKCMHSFKSSIGHINHMNSWCPYCAKKKLCNNNDCKLCFDNSFASNPKAIYWSNKNDIKPRNISKSNNRKCWFDCNKCIHSFITSLSNINSGKWCIYCANLKLCDNADCKFCFDNSFASNPKAIYWSNKNDIKPRNISKSNNRKCWFDCDKCMQSFITSLSHIHRGCWCPYCKNKTEMKLYEYLKSKYITEHQFKTDWCKNKNKLPFDFCIEEYKIIIELDGRQHFQQVSNWECPIKSQKKDVYKMKCANSNGYSVIRILQEDVYYDKYDWQNELISNIINIINKKEIQNIYMCKNNEYDCHKNINIDDIIIIDDDIEEDDTENQDIDTGNINNVNDDEKSNSNIKIKYFKKDLEEMCKKRNIKYTTKTTISQFIELLKNNKSSSQELTSDEKKIIEYFKK